MLSQLITINGRVDTASVTEKEGVGSISDQVKPKTTKVGIHSFPARRLALRGSV